tara:strand:- start:135 stop:398 length:264 start_codon:yes stop_codon:yes gene_type:complete
MNNKVAFMSVLNKKVFEQLKNIKLNFSSADSGDFYFYGKLDGKEVKAIVSEDNVCNIEFNVNESIANLSEFYFCQIFVDDEMIFNNH